MNLNKFYSVPLVALLTFTAVWPASAVLAEEGAGTATSLTETTPAPASTEPTTTEPPAPESETTPAPAEETPADPAPATTEDDVLAPSPTAPTAEPVPPAPTNSNTDIPVSGEIQVVQPSFSTDFNSLFFSGTVGDDTINPLFKMGTEEVTKPHIYMVATQNYSLMISGTDLLTTQGEAYTAQRLGVSVDGGTYVPLSIQPTLIDSGAGQLSIKKPIQFNLDLSTRNNSYPDNDRLQALTQDTEFTNTITFSYTGL